MDALAAPPPPFAPNAWHTRVLWFLVAPLARLPGGAETAGHPAVVRREDDRLEPATGNGATRKRAVLTAPPSNVVDARIAWNASKAK